MAACRLPRGDHGRGGNTASPQGDGRETFFEFSKKNLDRTVYVCNIANMSRGPDKQFDPDEALEKAMQLFWAKGNAATGVAELQKQMGSGRKSLYDTFGNKRQLFIKALQLYSDSVVRQIFSELNKEGSPLGNVRRVMRRLQEQHSMPESTGCLLGVSIQRGGALKSQISNLQSRISIVEFPLVNLQ